MARLTWWLGLALALAVAASAEELEDLEGLEDEKDFEDSCSRSGAEDCGAGEDDGDFAASLRESVAAWRLEQTRHVQTWLVKAEEMTGQMVASVQAQCKDRAARGFESHVINLLQLIPKEVSTLFRHDHEDWREQRHGNGHGHGHGHGRGHHGHGHGRGHGRGHHGHGHGRGHRGDLHKKYESSIRDADTVLKGLFLSKQREMRISEATLVRVKFFEVFDVVKAGIIEKLRAMGLRIEMKGALEIVVSWV